MADINVEMRHAGEVTDPAAVHQAPGDRRILSKMGQVAFNGILDRHIAPHHQGAGMPHHFRLVPIGPMHRPGRREILYDLLNKDGFKVAAHEKVELLFQPLRMVKIIIIPLAHHIAPGHLQAVIAELPEIQSDGRGDNADIVALQ